ncbi:MAG TPA: GlsB/YeaQ/YmgE family stress response membrane protein [Thermoleophilaceae bacterium]|nr:GlsB/YeaQ/YmgE family stress response membrane protein [Thermoleophilaceae bacterium]
MWRSACWTQGGRRELSGAVVGESSNDDHPSKEEAMIGALVLGLLAGFIGKTLMSGDDPRGFFATILLGLAGAALGWVIFTLGLGIEDEDAFDRGGLVGAIIGVMILLGIYRWWSSRRTRPTQAAT